MLQLLHVILSVVYKVVVPLLMAASAVTVVAVISSESQAKLDSDCMMIAKPWINTSQDFVKKEDEEAMVVKVEEDGGDDDVDNDQTSESPTSEEDGVVAIRHDSASPHDSEPELKTAMAQDARDDDVFHTDSSVMTTTSSEMEKMTEADVSIDSAAASVDQSDLLTTTNSSLSQFDNQYDAKMGKIVTLDDDIGGLLRLLIVEMKDRRIAITILSALLTILEQTLDASQANDYKQAILAYANAVPGIFMLFQSSQCDEQWKLNYAAGMLLMHLLIGVKRPRYFVDRFWKSGELSYRPSRQALKMLPTNKRHLLLVGMKHLMENPVCDPEHAEKIACLHKQVTSVLRVKAT